MQGKFGKVNPDGTYDYPETDLNGGSFARPATTLLIAPNVFIVLPPNYRDNLRIEEVRTEYTQAHQPAANVRSAKGSE